MKYRTWTLALAVSFCLTGVAGCGRRSTGDPVAPATNDGDQTTQTEPIEGLTEPELAEEEPTEEPVAEVTSINDISNIHREYDRIIEQNFMLPLKQISQVETADRSPQFVDSQGFDPSAVNNALGDLIDPLTTIDSSPNNGIYSDEDLEALAEIRTAARNIQSAIVQPMSTGAEDPYTSNDILVDPLQRDPNTPDTIQIIRSIYSNISGTEGYDPSESLNLEAVTEYDTSVYGVINAFFEDQNSLISGGIATISGSTATENGQDEGPTPEEKERERAREISRERRQTWLSAIAFFLGLVNVASLGFLIFLLRSRTKAEMKERANRPPVNNPTSAGDRRLEEISRIMQRLEEKVDFFEGDLTTQSKKVGLLDQRVSSIASSAPSPVTEYGTQPKVAYTTQVPPAETGVSRVRAQKSDPQHRGFTQPPTDAAAYNQNSDLFNTIATVALSQSSQENLRIGKSVIPVFSTSPQGDYWVITKDAQTFYIVVKDRALLNKNNLETLQILYAFENQPGLASRQRHYGKLAKVTAQSGNNWILEQRGELTFH